MVGDERAGGIERGHERDAAEDLQRMDRRAAVADEEPRERVQRGHRATKNHERLSAEAIDRHADERDRRDRGETGDARRDRSERGGRVSCVARNFGKSRKVELA